MIEIRGLTKTFNGQVVLDHIDLSVPRGETLVVIGRSGCGKSVLLRLVTGLLVPDAGSVSIDDLRLDRLNRTELYRLRTRFGVLFQGGALFDSLTIAQNVGLALRETLHYPEAKVQAIVAERLDWVGLEDVGDRCPSEVSGGMRKRAAMARAIAMNPQFVFYDEPTTGLDPVTAEGINDLIIRLHDRLRVTAIAVTHDMKSAFKIADRIAMLHEGHIVFNGTVAEAQTTNDPILHQFIAGETTGPLEPL